VLIKLIGCGELTKLIENWKMSLMDPVFMGLLEDKGVFKITPDRYNKQ